MSRGDLALGHLHHQPQVALLFLFLLYFLIVIECTMEEVDGSGETALLELQFAEIGIYLRCLGVL
jgi:hypothetical protein